MMGLHQINTSEFYCTQFSLNQAGIYFFKSAMCPLRRQVFQLTEASFLMPDSPWTSSHNETVKLSRRQISQQIKHCTWMKILWRMEPLPGKRLCMNSSAVLMVKSPLSIDGIFSVFSNKNGKHESKHIITGLFTSPTTKMLIKLSD